MNILQSNYGAHEGSVAKFVRTNLGMTLPHDAIGRMVTNILVYYLTSQLKMGKITDR
jgi:hypothetical protein